MISLSINADLTQVERKLVALGKVNLRPAFAKMRKPSRLDQRDHAKKQESESGSWPAHSPLTEARRGTKGRRRQKKLLGRLPGALRVTVFPKSIIVNSRVRWSGVHQFGGVVGKGARIPARPFVWASKPLLEQVAKAISAHIAEKWKGE